MRPFCKSLVAARTGEIDELQPSMLGSSMLQSVPCALLDP